MDKSDPSGMEYWRDRALGIVRKEITLPPESIITFDEVVKQSTIILNKKLKKSKNG